MDLQHDGSHFDVPSVEIMQHTPRNRSSRGDRLELPNTETLLLLAGQFHSAGGLVLLSGRPLGPQMSLPLARGINAQDEFVVDGRY
jgi:hypothetical protein